MNRNTQEFVDQYAAKLREYLTAPSEEGRMHAYELGRRALTLDVPVSELAAVHGRALVFAGLGTPEETAAVARSAAEFLTEALAPYEMGLRGYQEANTLLKRLNETLEQRVEERSAALREAGRRKDEFLAMLAHELRNPLAPIRNALQVLKLAGHDPAVLASTRELMERQLHNMVRLIDDLMDVARIARGKVELRLEPIDLATVLNSAVETSRPLIEAAGHELSIGLPSESVTLVADSVRLAQVIANLLNNSAKYTNKGGKIWINCCCDNLHAVISVRDNGLGIPCDMLTRVFELFTQLDRRDNLAQGGIGIGLNLVQTVVQLHGGSVEARSEGEGRGSEFIVRLPLTNATSPSTNLQSETGQITTPTPRRILVVDDNQDSAETLSMLLELTGNQTHTAYDGIDAVEAAAEFKPDIALLDIGLPRMNGYDAARKIRELPGGTKMVLVALTGWGQDGDRQMANEAGFDGHLVKPVDHDELMKLLSELGGSSLE